MPLPTTDLYKNHRFPPEIIAHAVWLYHRFSLSFREVEELLAERGVIGRVADQHLAYAGNQFDLSAIRMDSGPAGAKFLHDQGVDVVLLTPV